MAEPAHGPIEMPKVSAEPPKPLFMIRGARIRCNVDENRVAFFFGPASSAGAIGIVTLLGTTPETARIEDCTLEHDKSLPLGTMVIDLG